MTTVITAPESIDVPGYRVFLAGAIDMGAAEDWQANVIQAMQGIDDLVLINPRRAAFTAGTLDEQILWELDALENVNLIMMWLPNTSKAPVSFFEAGLYWTSGKLVIGAGPQFYRRRNLELTGKYYQQPLLDNLTDLIVRVLDRRNVWRKVMDAH